MWILSAGLPAFINPSLIKSNKVLSLCAIVKVNRQDLPNEWVLLSATKRFIPPSAAINPANQLLDKVTVLLAETKTKP